MEKFLVMLDYSFQVYNDPNPNNKDKEWATKATTIFRTYWRPLVNQVRAADNRAVLYGLNSICEVADSFEDEAFKKSIGEFLPLPLLQAVVNSIVEEITQHPPTTEVKAQDPLSINLKDSDIALLKSRKIIENDVTYIQQSTGMIPPGTQYKVPYDQFNGNVNEFDDMQLDENDPEDIDVFRSHFHRLWYEIGAQAALNAILKTSQFDEATMRTMVKDAFSCNTIASQSYVDQITGAIEYEYIDPSLMYGIWGTTNDGKNDVCRGWYKQATIMEWLSMVGKEFDFERDWTQLLYAINYISTNTYTGFLRGGITYSALGNTNGIGAIPETTKENLFDWTNAYMFKIWVGYIEWPVVEATSSYKKKGDYTESVGYDYELTKSEKKQGYEKNSYYTNQWYRCYFLATSSITQYVFGFQKLFFQSLPGFNDRYSNGSLHYYQEQGQSPVDISKTFLRVANFAYYRFLWLIYHAKPEQEEYVLDEILTLARAIQRETPQNNATGVLPGLDTYIQQAIQQQRKGHIKLRVFPKVDGKTIPQLPPDGRKREGIDPTAVVMQGVIEWAEARIYRMIGFNPMRVGANPPSRESLKSEENTVVASQNATGYFYRMLQYQKERQAITTLNYICDILQYPDTVPYKYLKEMLGDKTFKMLQSLGKNVPHRWAIFIKDSNMALLRQRIDQQIQIALSKGSISQAQAMMVTAIEDPKLATARLAIMERQTQKRQLREQQQLLEQQKQNALSIESANQQTEKIKAQTEIMKAQIQAQATMEAAKIAANSKESVKRIQVDAEPQKQRAKTDGDKELMETENNLKQQQPFTAPAGE